MKIPKSYYPKRFWYRTPKQSLLWRAWKRRTAFAKAIRKEAGYGSEGELKERR